MAEWTFCLFPLARRSKEVGGAVSRWERSQVNGRRTVKKRSQNGLKTVTAHTSGLTNGQKRSENGVKRFKNDQSKFPINFVDLQRTQRRGGGEATAPSFLSFIVYKIDEKVALTVFEPFETVF